VSAWQDVGSVADLERDGHVIARVDGREIGVLAVGG
jgi:nitrite reductase/ring-hydroxylating ferredoxin subunit